MKKSTKLGTKEQNGVKQMINFFIGLFVGGAIGFAAAAFCVAAKDSE